MQQVMAIMACTRQLEPSLGVVYQFARV